MKTVDEQVYEWIESHYGNLMPERLLSEHRRALIGQGNGRFIQPDDAIRGFLPADLDKILQTVKHARARIAAGHEPIPPEHDPEVQGDIDRVEELRSR